MSEYQYYEFQAIDRPLTAAEMRKLRAVSTRARITPTSFVNEYNWGDFKGDEDAWMSNYFDAFLYLANWGTHVLKLRLSGRMLDAGIAGDYCTAASLNLFEQKEQIVLTFLSEDEPGADWEEGEGQLSALIPLRAELARGDHRALYLGWLLGVQHGECDSDDPEPPVPPGLGELSASLDALLEFLRIDRDLVAVAAQGSAAFDGPGASTDVMRVWLGTLSARDKDAWLAGLIAGTEPALAAELFRRFRRETSEGFDRERVSSPCRTVADLTRAADARSSERRKIAAEKEAAAKEHREREAARARACYLDSLTGLAPTLWQEIDHLVASRQPKNYDRAVEILVDLRELAARGPRANTLTEFVDQAAFQVRIDAFRARHARKPSLVKRLREVGL